MNLVEYYKYKNRLPEYRCEMGTHEPSGSGRMNQCLFRFPDTSQAMQAYTTRQKLTHPNYNIIGSGNVIHWQIL